MALTQQQIDSLTQAAQAAGHDPQAVIAAAEQELGGNASSSDAPEQSGRPIAERLLIGFLPFIKVRELREHWLMLTDPIDDDELTCGEYQLKLALKYGATPSSTPSASPDE